MQNHKSYNNVILHQATTNIALKVKSNTYFQSHDVHHQISDASFKFSTKGILTGDFNYNLKLKQHIFTTKFYSKPLFAKQ